MSPRADIARMESWAAAVRKVTSATGSPPATSAPARASASAASSRTTTGTRRAELSADRTSMGESLSLDAEWRCWVIRWCRSSRSAGSTGRPPTVNGENLAVHVGSRRRGEEDHDVSDVFRLSPSAGWDTRRKLLQAHRVGDQSGVHVRGHVAGRYRVDIDA